MKVQREMNITKEKGKKSMQNKDAKQRKQ